MARLWGLVGGLIRRSAGAWFLQAHGRVTGASGIVGGTGGGPVFLVAMAAGMLALPSLRRRLWPAPDPA